MKVYLAHNFAAREYLRKVIPIIEKEGHEVTSSWIRDDKHLQSGNALQSAVEDLADIERAEAIILFTDRFTEDRPGKGKFIELGYAIRAGKICILVGKDTDSSVFYYLPIMRYARTVEQALVFLHR